MITNKYIEKIVAVIVALAVFLCLWAFAYSENLTELVGGTAVNMQYESKLFDTDEIIEVNILMDEEEWEDMLENAITEEYRQCDVEINGETCYRVGIRTKGNTSLTSIASDPDTDRYSLKLEFDRYVDGQTCYGLDKLILNNNYADATNMKEAIVYDMFRYLGANASLYNYAKVSVNGEYWGIYLALEAVEESFVVRNFGSENGELYKPESMDMGGDKGIGERNGELGGFKDGREGAFQGFQGGGEGEVESEGFQGGEKGDGITRRFQGGEEGNGISEGSQGGEEGEVTSEGFQGGEKGDGITQRFQGGEEGAETSEGLQGGEQVAEASQKLQAAGEGRRNGFRRGMEAEAGEGLQESAAIGGIERQANFGRSSGGADLSYTDDKLDSYSTIWEGAVTDSKDKDHERVITALRNIQEGTDLEQYLDVDNVLRYMAVHTFVVNLDSLSGNMAHNYYLYESDGQLNILPWDYNLAFGGMSMGNSGGAGDTINFAVDTPFAGTDFFDALLENEEYLAQYHEYLRLLAEEYVEGGIFQETYQRIRSQIDELVKTDPTAFYTYDEYNIGAEMLCEVIKLRAESVLGQLTGEIPSTTEGQLTDPSALIDSSGIDLSVMGSFGGRGGDDRGGDDRQGEFPFGNNARTDNRRGGEDTFPGSFTDSENAPQADTSTNENAFPAPPSDGNASRGNLPGGEEESQDNLPGVENTAPGGFSGDNMARGNRKNGEEIQNPSGEDTEMTADAVPAGNFAPMGIPGSGEPGMMGGEGNQVSDTVWKNMLIYGVSFMLLLAALLMLKCYRRKKFR